MSKLDSLSMNQSIIFTRYLYLKDEVLKTLVISLINKNENALYWAYELYYSGFEEELFEYLWKIYFDFYYTLNPGFQDYFVKKYKEWKTFRDDKIIALIINNLLIRPHNLDIFMLRQISKDTTIIMYSFIDLLENRDLLEISKYIFERKYDTIILESIQFFIGKGLKIDPSKFLKRWKKMSGYLQIDKNIQILAWIIHNFSQLDNIKMGKNLYILVDQSEIVEYETICIDDTKRFRAYQILPVAYKHKIDEDNYLSLFYLERNKIDSLKKMYWYNWEYYASLSPIWLARIKQYNGILNHQTKKLKFSKELEEELEEELDNMDEFYYHFGYEPDEQKTEIQEHSIQEIKCQRTWTNFYEAHKNNGIYHPDTEFLEQLICINY
jgi:hypothetical protein